MRYVVIAGVYKSGTTALFRYLGEHPSICPASVKELDFFRSSQNLGEQEALLQYQEHFRNCREGQVCLEASPGYISGGAALAQELVRVIPNVQVVFSLREPTDRLFSRYKSFHNRGKLGDMTFEAFVDKVVDPRTQGANTLLAHFFNAGCYAKHLKEWLDYIPAERVGILFFDDLVADVKGFVSQACRFIRVDPGFYDQHTFRVENKGRKVKSQRFHRIAHRLNRKGESILNRLPHWVKVWLRETYYSVNEEAVSYSMSERACVRSQEAYAPHNRELHDLLVDVFPDVVMPAWLTDITGTDSPG